MGMFLKYWCETKKRQEEIQERVHLLPMMKIAADYLEDFMTKN